MSTEIILAEANQDDVKWQEIVQKVTEFERTAVDALESVQSANSMMEVNLKIIHQGIDGLEGIQGLRKQFILDSFRVDRFQKSLREWEIKQSETFVSHEVESYNKITGQMSRDNGKLETSATELELLKRTVEIPKFTFARQTLEEYGGDVLNNIPRDAEGLLPSSISVDQIYSVDPQSGLPFPDFEVFNKLVNIEYRLRLGRRIKYEILVLIKNQIIANNSKWSARDQSLNDFITNKLSGVIDEVEKIKAHEYEDLNLVEESDEELESFEQDQEHEIDEDEEEEENEQLEEEAEALPNHNRAAVTTRPPETQEEESDDEMLIDS